MAFRVLVVLSSLLVCLHAAEPNLITQPQPGQEYVFVQTSDTAGARPVVRKEKEEIAERETAHKLPPTLTYLLQEDSTRDKRDAAKVSAAPAGAIKLDPLKLIEKYKAELATSTTTTSTSTAKPSTTKRTGTKRPRPSGAPRTTSKAPRTKKEVNVEDAPTTASSILTTPQAGERKASGTENKKSRIHVKKGPNGQDYEYEYVYYYYNEDEDEDPNNKTEEDKEKNTVAAKPTAAPTPTKAEKPNQNSAEKSSAKAEPASNEVVPVSKTSGKSKSWQLDEEESNVDTERLPANTRFPPRGRNLATSPSTPAETITEETPKPQRGRSRGRPTTTAAPAEPDSTSEETRGRTRTNVRRPSLELVDSATFNTHSSGGEPPIGGPSFPSDLPAGPVRFLGATPNERMDLQEKSNEVTSTEHVEGETTTLMSAMDKVALDLYAVVQGTQKLSGEDSEETSTNAEDETTTLQDTTPEATTFVAVTETTTPSTTTTTTTTPAPSTSAAPDSGSPFRPQRPFGRRGGISGRKSTPSASTTESSAKSADSERPKSRFGNHNNHRPSFGGGSRSRTRTTAEPSGEQEVTKEEAKPVSHSRTPTRNRFGAGRTRPTTAASAPSDESQSSTSAPSRPSLPRSRPSFNGGRRRGLPTPAPVADGDNKEASSEVSSTTARSRVRPASSGLVRPLRPGPRINGIGRLGKPGASSTTPAAIPEGAAEVSSAEETNTNPPEDTEKSAETSESPAASTQDPNPLNRLRNRQRLTVSARPKTAASAPVPVRRVNPLLGRRKIAEPSSTTEAVNEVSAEDSNETVPASSAEEESETEPVAASSSTTEEPRGLSKLLAGRRRLAARQPGTIN